MNNGGKNRYEIFYNDGTVSFGDHGWYAMVSGDHFESIPWGPFNDQREAIESLLIEWPRFESGYFTEDDKS